jgi:hypothetical protein
MATGGIGQSVGIPAWTLSSGKWGIASIPSEASSVASLSAVSCWAHDACIAVGSVGKVDAAAGLALQLSSGSWQAMTLPSGIYALLSVSCVGPKWCMAIGWATRASNDVAVLWNGATWQQVSLATTVYSTSLFTVSCASSTFCMTVGSGDYSPFAEDWNGTSWLVTTTPDPPPPGKTSSEGFRSVSCTSENFCLAVGATSLCCGEYRGLAWTWNGTSWNDVASGGLNQVQLEGVSCATFNSCLAVGGSGPSDVEPLPYDAVIARWTGAALNAVPIKAIGQASSLYEVSCTRPAWCTGVGWFKTKVGYQPLVERWNGVSIARMWAPV